MSYYATNKPNKNLKIHLQNYFYALAITIFDVTAFVANTHDETHFRNNYVQ